MKILNIAHMAIASVIITERIILKYGYRDMEIDHIITYPTIYLVSLYPQDLRKYYRLKGASFLDTLYINNNNN